MRRAHAPWLGLWCAPGGFCDADEHPIDAVEREVYEETGVPVRATRFIGIWLDEYRDASDDGESDVISVAYYEAEPIADPDRPPDPAEVAEARWFAWDELPEDLAPPGTLRAVLNAWRAARASGWNGGPLPDRPP